VTESSAEPQVERAEPTGTSDESLLTDPGSTGESTGQSVDQRTEQPAEGSTEGSTEERAGAEDPSASPARSSTPSASGLERESEIAADYLEELLDIADLDGDIDMDIERDRASVSVVGGDLDHLVGSEGAVLDALQELTRLAVLTATGERSRLMLDIGGFRAGRRAVLTELGSTTAEQVKESGEPVRLDPMNPFERKVVHDAVAAAGLRSESEGEEPHRRVVVLPG
jgi:spoIIIJ-associated protein